MNIEKFLELNLAKIDGLTHVPFLSEYYDIETPSMRCLSYALVDADQQIKAFKTEIELVNDMPHSNECPCLIDTSWTIDYPKLSDEQLEGYLLENAINFQSQIINIMIDGKVTDDLREIELDAISAWDKKHLLKAPDELEEDMNYVYISHMAANWLAEHMRKWLQTIAK